MSQKNPNQIRKNLKSQRQSQKTSRQVGILNRSFMINERKEIRENMKKYPSLDEAASKILRTQLERASSPNVINLCDHCSHNHNQRCCLMVYDDWSDVTRYSNFKNEIDVPYWVMNSSEDFDMTIGNTTPNNFPTSTVRDPVKADQYNMYNFAPPVVYLRQYVWPVIFSTPFHVPVYQPCIMNQIVLQQGKIVSGREIPNHPSPQIIESHSFMPIHYDRRW